MAVVFVVLVLGSIVYFYIWGGAPYIEDFNEEDYETIADLALEYGNQFPDREEHITIFAYEDYLMVYGTDEQIHLNEEQKAALKTVQKTFGALWVTKDAVIFGADERKHYGLVYSENPLSAIWDMKNDWHESLEYHRINGDWYEIGVWGI